MKLGLNILNFGPGTSADSLRKWARFAEDTGFALVTVSDHVAITPDVAAVYPTPFYDPFVTLAALAAVTQRVQLGTSVVVLPYRNPLLIARMAANLDQFSSGRFVLGVGTGWSVLEYAALGVRFADRGAITDEYLEVILAAWAEEQVSMQGRHVSFEKVRTAPGPLRLPRPPVWVGGSSARALDRAGRFGEAWHPINPGLSWMRDAALPKLEHAAARFGRPTPALCPRIRIDLRAEDVRPVDRRLGTGSLGQIVDDLQSLRALGAQYLVLDPYPGRPEERRPDDDDRRTLETIVGAWTAYCE